MTNKSADHIGISNLIRGIIHEHPALKGGGNAAGKDRPELVCASRLIRLWKREAGNIAGRTATCVETWTRQSTQENGEVPQQCKKIFFFEISKKESLSCNTKRPADREDIL